MRIATVLLFAFGLSSLGSRPAVAQPLTALTVSGPPAIMTISSAIAGSQPTAITDATTTYFIKDKTPSGARKITASINAPMPPGTTLSINLVPSALGTNLGPVNLSTISQDVVVNISKENGSTLGITYVFSATLNAGVVPAQSRTVMLTLVTYP
jgi:hypothetical protein